MKILAGSQPSGPNSTESAHPLSLDELQNAQYKLDDCHEYLNNALKALDEANEICSADADITQIINRAHIKIELGKHICNGVDKALSRKWVDALRSPRSVD